jgi:hypothetical protein
MQSLFVKGLCKQQQQQLDCLWTLDDDLECINLIGAWIASS